MGNRSPHARNPADDGRGASPRTAGCRWRDTGSADRGGPDWADDHRQRLVVRAACTEAKRQPSQVSLCVTRAPVPRFSTRRPVVLAIVAALVGVACTVGCDQGGLERHANVVMQRTVPPGVATPYASMDRTQDHFEARWEFTTTMPDAAYRDWVGQHVGSLFTNQRTDAEGLTFSHPLEGDLHTLRITLSSREGELRVQAEFIARPW